MPISLQDVFDSIYDDQGWTVISYLYSKIVLPEIKRDHIRRVWAEHNGIVEAQATAIPVVELKSNMEHTK